MSSSESSGSEEAIIVNQRTRQYSTPRTEVFPEEGFAELKTSKPRHSSSAFNVHFEDVVGPEETSSSRLGAIPKSPVPAPMTDTDEGTTRVQTNTQTQLLERIETLENQLCNLELSRHLGSSEKGDESSERTGLNTEIQWMTWQEYLEDASKASNVMEVLIEKPHTNSRGRKSSVALPTLDTAQKASTKPPTSPYQNIERIRIRSYHIINALQLITEQTFTSSTRLIIHRPFKVLLFYREQILDFLVDLEHNFAENTQCRLGRKCKGFIDFENKRVSTEVAQRKRGNSIQGDSYNGLPADVSGDLEFPTRDKDECGHEISEELLAQVEAITHLRILTKFMTEDMADVFAKHALLRSSEAKSIAFQDMWHLFMAGDLVVAKNDSNDRGLELYQIAILPACDVFSSRRQVKQIQTKTEGSHQMVESVYGEEANSAMSVFTVDVFYFDFDGQKFGPVERRLEIVNFEGEKNIVDLPLYPLRFMDDASNFKDMMLARGKKFQQLSMANEYPHREYNGLSVGEPQEQVIIDFALAYRNFPKNAPHFGIRSWIEDDARIVTEACGIPGCTDCFKDRFMFDDHRVDRQRTVEFIRAHGNLLRTISSSDELTDDMMLLLPNRVYGFVLRSRRWHFLNLDHLRGLERHSGGFENLILPQGVARLVESLVKTHDPQNMPSFTGNNYEQEHHVDLVRGKGKGLIILLHGAPGVGKTSTAECVADYTQRPLFPITCGDIGETSREVEHNLEQNFSLAHRWGCVLLVSQSSPRYTLYNERLPHLERSLDIRTCSNSLDKEFADKSLLLLA
ncbi:MAG: hypothetical protein Q9174_005108 [Haloplaca sp. 1 TL-2023]